MAQPSGRVRPPRRRRERRRTGRGLPGRGGALADRAADGGAGDQRAAAGRDARVPVRAARPVRRARAAGGPPRPPGHGNQTSERRRTSRRGRSTPSTTPAHRDELRQISDNDDTAIAGLVAIRVEEAVESSDLDAKTFSLVNLAALIATGGDDASYLLHVGAALDAGASVDEVTGVLTAIAPNVGVFKMVAAADPLATALGITIAEDDASDAS